MSETRQTQPNGRVFCHACKLDRQRRYREANPSHYRYTPEQRRKYRLKSKFGKDVMVADMLQKQDGKCAICKSPDFAPRGPNVDHDHETGEIRGLLCMKCNVGIGMFADSTEVMESAIAYLRK